MPRTYSSKPSEFRAVVKSADGRKRRVWRVARSVYVDGKRKQIVGQGNTHAEAWAAYDALWEQWQVKAGLIDPSTVKVVVKEPKRRTDGRTFGMLVDEWWPIKKTEGAAPQSLQRYEEQLRNHIRPHFGEYLLTEVTEASIRAFIYETLPAKTRTKADGTVVRLLGGSPIRKIFLLIREVLDYAVRKRYLAENPATHVKTPKYDKESSVDISKLTWLPGALLKNLAGTPEAGYWVLMFLGLRQSERLGLGWSSFENLANKRKTAFVSIDRQLDPYVRIPASESPTGKNVYDVRVKFATKTRAGERKFALSEEVRREILAWKKQQDAWKKTDEWVESKDRGIRDLVFTYPDGRPIRQQADLKKWDDLFDRLSEDSLAKGNKAWERPTPHTMRHIAATILAKEGVPPRHAMKILGHSGEAMTAYYTHLAAADTIESINALSASIFAPSLKTLTAEEAVAVAREEQAKQSAAGKKGKRKTTARSKVDEIEESAVEPTQAAEPDVAEAEDDEEMFETAEFLALREKYYEMLARAQKARGKAGALSPQATEALELAGFAPKA